MKAMSSPDYEYRPWPMERRVRASVAARKRLGVKGGHYRICGIDVPEEFAAEIRKMAIFVYNKFGVGEAQKYVGAERKAGFPCHKPDGFGELRGVEWDYIRELIGEGASFSEIAEFYNGDEQYIRRKYLRHMTKKIKFK